MAIPGITAPVPAKGYPNWTYDKNYGPLFYWRGNYYAPDQLTGDTSQETGATSEYPKPGAQPFVPSADKLKEQAPAGYLTTEQAAYKKYPATGATEDRFEKYERLAWPKLLPQLGFQGQVQSSTYVPDESVEGGTRESFGLTPEAQSFINNLKQQGYRIVVDENKVLSGSKYTTRLGLADPQGNILSNWETQEGSYFDQLGPMLAAFTPAFLGIGNALASGAVGGGANALAGAGIGGIEGAAFADLAAGMLPEFGTNAAYSAGLSGGTGLGGALTLQDIPGGFGNVLGQAGQTPVVDVADLAPVTTPSAAATAMDLAGGSADLMPGVMGGGQFSAAGGFTGIPFLDKAIDFVTSPAGSAIVSGVGNVVGGIAGANAAEKAAETQAGAADRAIALQEKMYQDYLDMTKDYREAGVNALGKLTRGEILPEPGYAFRLGEGMKALERVQAARGNMLSGGALKAGQRYAQDLASQEYGNAYNRLANIAGLGQTATTQAGTAGQNYASQAGELGLQQANALAQGRIGRASSYGNALLGAAGALQDYVQAPMKEQMFRDIYGRLMGKP